MLLTAKDKKSHKNHRSRRRTFNLSILQSFPIINCVYACIWLACVYFMVYKNLKVGILSRFQGSLLQVDFVDCNKVTLKQSISRKLVRE